MTNSIGGNPFLCGRNSPETEEAARKFELAMIDLRKAVDSRGLRIMLYRGTSYTSEGFRDALREITSAPFSGDKVVYLEDIPGTGEITFARHLQLLTNCYVAALEYERALTGLPAWPPGRRP